ncbi:putative ATP-dependent RNA helicase DHR1 [Recurvomyces mirabilis]|nr:putative ATP-dependent RNA helicase DHR1 [Recurvomyces mirabilis]
MAQYKPRERKRRRLDKARDQSCRSAESIPDETDSSQPTEKDVLRTNLTSQIRGSQPDKISSKKKKRLDKYIDTKLKKDENLELLKKLAAHKVDTSLLQSSRKLGRVHETKRERFGRALREQRAGIDGHEDVLYESRREVEDDEEDGVLGQAEEWIVGPTALPVVAQPTLSFGTGLKRPLDIGEDGRPAIKKRKRRKLVEEQIPDEDEWVGFASEDDEISATSAVQEVDEVETNISEDESDSGNESSSEGSNLSTNDDPSSLDSGAGEKKERVSAFKQWATAQRNTALDFQPSALPTQDPTVRANFQPRQASPDPVAVDIVQQGGERTSRPAAAITIVRPEAVQAARMELPVVQEEQKIMEAIHHNPISIICGATGSGKTTQVPQMMFESGYGSAIGDRSTPTGSSKGAQSKGMIGVTQPRRVAATSVADRVATELGPTYKNRVAHQVRYDSNVSRDTAIKFMTDGILLREIGNDFILSKYSAIVIDEAHERSVNTDILIGMLSRIVRLRAELANEDPEKHYPLKMVIMSATLRVNDFAENRRLFRDGPPPIVEAEGRQFPVTVHFSRKTQRDYVAETVEKVARGHRKLPSGGMLIFLTSQNEITAVAKRLKEKLGGSTAGMSSLETDDLERARPNNDYLEGEDQSDSDSDIQISGLDSDNDDQEFQVEDEEAPQFGRRAPGILQPHILPLYAALPTAQQLRVFQPTPSGARMIVLATNVAETSLTIPGIRYVFDCGRAKEKHYDISTGVQTFEIDWISQASAAQRTGRAGRTGPGHCYRLFSSAVYEQFFAEHTVPEILRTPLESTVLQLKTMNIGNVPHFPFPTAPDAVQLAQAERLLRNLGAVGRSERGEITDLGRQIMGFPVSPRFGKTLLLAQRNGVVPFAVAIVAGLAVGDLFIPEAQFKEQGRHEDSREDSDDEDRKARRAEETAMTSATQRRHQAYTRAHASLSQWDDQADIIKLLTTIAAHADNNTTTSSASVFCEQFFLREKGMQEIQQLRHQLHNIVAARHSALLGTFKNALTLPSEKQRGALKQLVTVGYLDQVAIRSDLLPSAPVAPARKPRRAIEVPYTTLLPCLADEEVDKTASPEEQVLQRSVFIHPSSVLAKLSVPEMPGYIVYSHLSRAAPRTLDNGRTPRTRMHPLTTVGAKNLAALAEGSGLLEMGKPIGKIEDLGVGRRQCWVEVSLKAGESGSVGWPLGAWKVVQKRGSRGAWEVENVVAR